MNKSFIPISLLLAAGGVGFAQKIVHPQFKSPVIPEEREIARRDLTWVDRAWTGDNKPYHEIRTNIDNAILSGKSADDLRQEYGLIAQQKPNDPKAQFAWAYAALTQVAQELLLIVNPIMIYGVYQKQWEMLLIPTSMIIIASDFY